mgnify:CR=1 FL=1
MNRINSKACRQTNITTAEEAIKAIKENDYVVFSGMTAIPEVIPQALMAHKEAYHNVHFFHMLAFGNGACLRPEAEGHFHHITNFAGVNSRKALEEQRADFIPCYFKDVPSMLGSAFPVDVAVVQVSQIGRAHV